MNQYVCCVCHNPFERYSSRVSSLSPTCSKICQKEKAKETFGGSNNPNYKSGLYCEKSICKCGKEKDYRANSCATCAKKSSPKDKTSLVSDELIIQNINSSKTFLEVAKKSKVSRKRVSDLVAAQKINVSHFRRCNFRPYTAEQLLCISDSRMNGTVKKFIKQNNLLKYKCECGNEGQWKGIELLLELHHKNGNPRDNRIENLTYLCPNCHSQTSTNKGKNSRKQKA